MILLNRAIRLTLKCLVYFFFRMSEIKTILGTPFAVSIFRMPTGTELVSMQVREGEKIWRFNIGERNGLIEEIGSIERILSCKNVKIETEKDWSGMLKLRFKFY